MTVDISKFGRCKVLVVGDLMVDEYLWGEVDRVSPEAPVQVVSVEREDYTLGGSGNVINNLAALGVSVSAAGVIGTDRHGGLLIDGLKALGVDTGGIIPEPERPTTRKTRIIAGNQHVLRIDRETTRKISEKTFKALNRFLKNTIPRVDLVLISDYGKGVITADLLQKVFAWSLKHKKITIADPKGLDYQKYAGAWLLTPNKKEAALAAGIDITDESSLHRAGRRIIETARARNLLITCGKEGMVLFEHKKEPFTIAAQARQVYDVSGAGDTVLAVLGAAIASGAPFQAAAALANTAAGIVVGKVGTATVSRQELETALKPCFSDIAAKSKTVPEIAAIVKDLRKHGKKIVLTNGCFDLLHVGHIMLFSASKQIGDVLIVAIDDDASVKALKEPGRPLIDAKDRVRILSAIDSVDYVVVFASKTLDKLIRTIRPDILTKGSNYTSDQVYGRDLVEKLGGRVELIPVQKDISATRLIDEIKKR